MPVAMTSPIDRKRAPAYAIWILAVFALGIVIATVLLVLYWPFKKSAVIRALQDASSTTVEIKSYRNTYFPHPGCIAEQVTFRQELNSDKPPLIAIDKLTIQANFLGLLSKHINSIRADGMRIWVALGGKSVHSRSESNVVIDQLVADGAVLQVVPRTPSRPPLVFAIHQGRLRSVGGLGPVGFQVNLSNPEPPGEVSASGQIGPWNVSAPTKTHVAGDYSFQRADLAAFPGIAGMLSSTGKFSGLLEHITVQGDTDVPDFEVKMSGHQVDLKSKFDAFVDATQGDTFLNEVDSHFRKTTVLSKGSIAGKPGQKGKSAIIDLWSKNGRIQDILQLFVKADRAPMSGLVSLRARATIPPGKQRFLKKVGLEGDFGVDAGTFGKPTTQEDVNKLSAESRGVKDDSDASTVLSDLKGHVIVKDGIATFTGLSFSVPGASAEMHGTYDLISEAINLHGTLKLDSELSNTAHGMKSLFLKFMDPFFKGKHGGSLVPIKIAGNYEKPSFGLDLNGQKEGKTAKRLQHMYQNPTK